MFSYYNKLECEEQSLPDTKDGQTHAADANPPTPEPTPVPPAPPVVPPQAAPVREPSGHAERQPEPPAPKAYEETPTDKAARSTARATWVIAAFTIILAFVGAFTLYEVIAGGNDTHELAVQAKNQADAAKILAEQAKAQTGKADTLIQKAVEQAAATNRLAGQAKRSADVARQSFDFTNRPYIGIDQINIGYGIPGSDELAIPSPSPKVLEIAKRMRTTVAIKNFGPVSGSNCVLTWRVLVDGNPIPMDTVGKDKPFTFLPTEVVALHSETKESDYARISRGESVLSFELTTEYDGPSQHYKECTKQQYSKDLHAYVNLGPQCSLN